MDLVILGDIFCDIIASKVQSLPKWNTDTLARGGIHTMAGGTGLNNAIHAANYIEWLLASGDESNIQYHNFKVHLFGSVCNDVNGNICKLRINNLSPILIDHCISPPIVTEIPFTTSTCIVLSGEEDRCFITDRGCNLILNSSWFDREGLIGDSNSLNSPARKRLLHIAGYYNCDNLSNGLVELLQQVDLFDYYCNE